MRSVLICKLIKYVCMYYMLCAECLEIHTAQFHHAYLKGTCNLRTLVTGNSTIPAENNRTQLCIIKYSKSLWTSSMLVICSGTSPLCS